VTNSREISDVPPVQAEGQATTVSAELRSDEDTCLTGVADELARGYRDGTTDEAHFWSLRAAYAASQGGDLYITNVPSVAGDLTIGPSEPSSSPRPQRRAGLLSRRELDAQRERYVEGPHHNEALGILTRDHYVVLVGAEGSGRRFAGLALLGDTREVITVRVLSPGMRLREVLNLEISKGVGFLIQDPEVPADEADSDDALRSLGAALREEGAYLVCTSRLTPLISDPTLTRTIVPWRPPDPIDIFGKSVTTANEVLKKHEDVVSVLREMAPRQAARLGSLIADDHSSVEAAIADAYGGRREEVATWFDAGPDLNDVLLLTGITFLPGCLKSEVEGEVTQLRESFPPDEITTFRLQQRRRLSDWSFVKEISIQSNDDGSSLRSIIPRDAVRFDWILHELWDRYGADYWDRVFDWIHDLANHPSVDRRIALAYSTARLACMAEKQVEVDLLTSWASGPRSTRLTAIYCLGHLSADDELADQAWRLARRWRNSDTPQLVWSGTLVLGGPLGWRYLDDTLSELWNVRVSDGADQDLARVALFSLISDSTASNSDLSSLLAFVRSQVDGTSSPLTRRSQWAAVLGMVAPCSPQRLIDLMRAEEGGDSLTSLIAGLLTHRPTRSAALDMIGTMLADAEATTQSGANDLFEAVAAQLPPVEQIRIRRLLHTRAERHHRRAGERLVGGSYRPSSPGVEEK
jgi:hypothetical protein